MVLGKQSPRRSLNYARSPRLSRAMRSDPGEGRRGGRSFNMGIPDVHEMVEFRGKRTSVSNFMKAIEYVELLGAGTGLNEIGGGVEGGLGIEVEEEENEEEKKIEEELERLLEQLQIGIEDLAEAKVDDFTSALSAISIKHQETLKSISPDSLINQLEALNDLEKKLRTSSSERWNEMTNRNRASKSKSEEIVKKLEAEMSVVNNLVEDARKEFQTALKRQEEELEGIRKELDDCQKKWKKPYAEATDHSRIMRRIEIEQRKKRDELTEMKRKVKKARIVYEPLESENDDDEEGSEGEEEEDDD